MPCNDINALADSTRQKAILLFQKCKNTGIELVLVETKRELITQLIYYIQGRLDADDVQEYNKIRKTFNLHELSEDKAKAKITWTLKSKHMEGKAFDVAVKADGKLTYNISGKMWEMIGSIGESVGLVWGGRWKEKDYPHFEE